jgi:hypothetical protein
MRRTAAPARSCGNRAFGGGRAIVGVIYSAIRILFRAVSTVTWDRSNFNCRLSAGRA